LKSKFATAMLIALIVGLSVGALLRSVALVDNLIPDFLNGLITGGFGGAAATIYMGWSKK